MPPCRLLLLLVLLLQVSGLATSSLLQRGSSPVDAAHGNGSTSHPKQLNGMPWQQEEADRSAHNRDTAAESLIHQHFESAEASHLQSGK